MLSAKHSATVTTRMKFFELRGSKNSNMVESHYLFRSLENIALCTDFELFKAKVPIDFLGMVGFSG